MHVRGLADDKTDGSGYIFGGEHFAEPGDGFVEVFLVPCSSHNYGLTEGQGVVGAKRGGLRMDAYVDDERQSPRPLGPRP